ncbi:iron-containing alcohol dehydrogenase [Dongia deserti]|uniref:iron-containing alcohol dehydrogenase n=1 Tax=Dongia deserti TaxID=2268030 RepID=UPI000E656CA2|nr:iron-containing alcohol dehydrogenase [Dongia deserti]
MARWTSLIDDMVAGRWTNPETGKPGTVPYKMVVIEERLDGAEADLVGKLGFRGRLAVVSDENTHGVMGARVEAALKKIATIDSVVLDHPHADEGTIALLQDRVRHADAVVAVGSGTINDLCKYVTAQDGRPYCVFATAPSMNGYTSTTASIAQANGLKLSKPAHAPKGVFIDLAVNAAAPTYLIASGFGDCLARSVAQVDCWLSKTIMGTSYSEVPFQLELADEAELMKRAAGLAKGDIEAVGYLHRVLTLCGFGVSFTGTTNHGSMGEHQISHYIDCFAGERHPGTLHGQQVGVASLTMARLQAKLLASDKAPVIHPTRIDEADMRRRFGADAAKICQAEMALKSFDAAGADKLNAKLEAIWPELRAELTEFTVPVQVMRDALAVAGGPTTAAELGLDVAFYREAVCHAREIRRRYSALDVAADAGILEAFAAGEG